MKNLGKYALFSLVVLTGQSMIEERWLYVTDPLVLERPEDAPEWVDDEMADGMILVFDPNGSYAAVACTLYRVSGDQVAPILSEGYIIWSGSWQLQDDRIEVRYQDIYASVRKVGLPIGVQRQVTFELFPPTEEGRIPSRLKSSLGEFVPVNNLEDPEGLGKLIEFHREHPEK